MNGFLRRALIGLIAGLVASPILAATVGNVALAVVLGAGLGVGYSLAFRPASSAYVDSLMTAAAFAVPLWGVVQVIALPVLMGQGPQWSARGMAGLFPSLVGWTLFGAALGLLAQALTDGALAWLGPEKAEAALKTLKRKLPSSTFGELVAAAPQLPSWLARSVGKVAHG